MSEYKLGSDKIENILVTFLLFIENIIDHDQGYESRTINGEHLRLTIDIFKNRRGQRPNDRMRASRYEIEETMKGELTVNELPEGVEPGCAQSYYPPDKNTTQRAFLDSANFVKSVIADPDDLLAFHFLNDSLNPVVNDLKSYHEAFDEIVNGFEFLINRDTPFEFDECERIRYNNLIKAIRDY